MKLLSEIRQTYIGELDTSINLPNERDRFLDIIAAGEELVARTLQYLRELKRQRDWDTYLWVITAIKYSHPQIYSQAEPTHEDIVQIIEYMIKEDGFDFEIRSPNRDLLLALQLFPQKTKKIIAVSRFGWVQRIADIVKIAKYNGVSTMLNEFAFAKIMFPQKYTSFDSQLWEKTSICIVEHVPSDIALSLRVCEEAKIVYPQALTADFLVSIPGIYEALQSYFMEVLDAGRLDYFYAYAKMLTFAVADDLIVDDNGVKIFFNAYPGNLDSAPSLPLDLTFSS